ncbi:MAG TPA: cytochrome c [Verrucomicrobiota bacterium]|nr:cytochrome c [Verrucomicrobiota bacterium]
MKKILTLCSAVIVMSALIVFAADGKAGYEKSCAKCHGKDGAGQTAMGKKLGAKDYTDPKVQEALTDAAGIKAIKEGFKNADGKELMKPTEGVTDEEAKAMIDYMRTFKK